MYSYDYGIILWGTAAKCHIYPLYVLQKKAIRIITHAKYNAHSSPLFKELQILNIQDIHLLNICRFMYDYHHSTLPNALSNIFQSTHIYITTTQGNTRIITHAKYNAHSSPLSKELQILNIQDIHLLNICRFMYDYHHSTLPNALSNIFQSTHIYITTTQGNTRIITHAKYNAHSSPLSKELQILNIQDIHLLNICRFMYDYHHSTLPNALSNIFQSTHIYITTTQGNTHIITYKVTALL